jgi:hypothetical protein
VSTTFVLGVMWGLASFVMVDVIGFGVLLATLSTRRRLAW